MANLKLIRKLAKDKNITIRELAQKIGRNESSIQSAIRRGTTNSTTIELMAKELGVSAGIFFDGFDGGEATAEQRREIAHLKELLKEKERTIEILMSDRNAKK
ncbi:helix-turn-helix domain-containing protein [Bacteroides acidifaciens]|uniref:helix-turn-helix domain-containing protein n=1 Tax=Bacteroides acidifaciens TaxID=85831 RepID=UPI00262D9440|nr:helix-turn-helix transcriptional regulator [Bacteroides acidifaciens]